MEYLARRHPIPPGEPQEPCGGVCEEGMLRQVGCSAGQVTAKLSHYEEYPWSRRGSPAPQRCGRVR
jgi:hypothetical protein